MWQVMNHVASCMSTLHLPTIEKIDNMRQVKACQLLRINSMQGLSLRELPAACAVTTELYLSLPALRIPPLVRVCPLVPPCQTVWDYQWPTVVLHDERHSKNTQAWYSSGIASKYKKWNINLSTNMASEAISEHLILKIFLGEHAPSPQT